MVRNELMAGLNPAYGYPEKFHPQAAEFFMNYTLEKELGCPNEKISNLLPPKDRICRFCSLKYPSVTFRKDAHIYSEFLGNKYLLSDFECDNCNLRFGTYEDHFSKFLGIARTMLSVKGKEKIHKCISPGGKVVIESDLGEGNQTIIHAKRAITSDETFVFDAETKTTKINFTKHPYIPVKAYKALLKMALSCIDEKELWAYKMAFEYLKNGKHDKEWIGMAHVYR
ncbi:MAG: HNH endonuclease [Bacteroidota bacterium]|nr:HNH endonuclease [Bacteroidota bacterium]